MYVPTVAERDRAIDGFRGLAVMLMVPANYLEHVAAVPAWLKHAPDVGLTVIDFVAPLFMFAIGLTMPGALRRRFEREGRQRAIEALLRRNLALIGLGALFSLGETSYGFNPKGVQWGVLQAIGAASLLGAPAMLWLKPLSRAGLALALLALWQVAVERFWLEPVLASPHGGLHGVLSWTALLLLASAVGDVLHRPPVVLGAGLVSVFAGVGLAFVVPLSKHRVSAPYVLITLGAAVLLFVAVRALRLSRDALMTWGRNPLVLYCAHLVLLGAFLVPDAAWWHREAPLWQAALQFLGYAGVLHLLARVLERQKVFVSL